MATQQQLADGLCLRFSGDIQNQPALSIEMAVNLLIRGTQASSQLPYAWGYIDRPAGMLFSSLLSRLVQRADHSSSRSTQMVHVYLFIASHMTFPNDGMRFQENEQRFAIAAGHGRVRRFSIKIFTPLLTFYTRV
jgi:hypothetical protein